MKFNPNHPAILLGDLLKSLRQAKGFVKRIFAEKVYLTPSKYTEVEAGVVSWIEKKNEDAMVFVLELKDNALSDFKILLAEARKFTALKFNEIFSREQLTPLRARLSTDRAISDMEREIILDAVFTPLT